VDRSAATWNTVQNFMRERCGVILRENQRYLLDARLGPVATKLKFSNVHEYVNAAVATNARHDITMRMIDAMTTHETFFFRDRNFWSAFSEDILPQTLANKAPGAPLRIWSAACSTGQEVYTLAIALAEHLPAITDDVQIWASDVSDLSIERAKQGRFSLLEVNRGLSAGRLLKHFTQEGTHFCVKEELTRNMRWFNFNLLGTAEPPVACDIVLCRNVLIYFDEAGRKHAIGRLVSGATRRGFVGVGATEMLPGRATTASWYSASDLS